MKAVLFLVFIALLSAFAYAQSSNNAVSVCVATQFNLTRESTQIVLVPGLISLYYGYQVAIVESSVPTQIEIQGASITFTASCQGGGSVTFNSPLANQTYSVPANTGNNPLWNPSNLYMSGFQSGPVNTNPVCGENVQYAITSAIFNGGLLSSGTNSVQIRFSYYVNINLGLTSPLPGSILTGGEIAVWLGNGAYSDPRNILTPICAALSASSSGSVSGSLSSTGSVSTSVSVSGSTTVSQTAQPTCTNPRRCVPRTTILGSPRKYLRRD